MSGGAKPVASSINPLLICVLLYLYEFLSFGRSCSLGFWTETCNIFSPAKFCADTTITSGRTT